MAVYSDIIFPECLSYGSEARPTYDTIKTEVASGDEQRFTRQLYVKNLYRINIQNMPAPEMQEIINIFHVCRGSLHSFMFKDFTDSTSKNYAGSVSGETISGLDQALGEDGLFASGTTYYNLYKRYTYASRSVKRRIRYPVTGSLIVFVNGVLNTAWAWDATEQAVHWPSGAPADGATITAGFEFYVPVRFDEDAMGIEPTNGLFESQVANLNDIRLVEVFE
jgi:uncharacterized protein (TIGR02217 family)